MANGEYWKTKLGKASKDYPTSKDIEDQRHVSEAEKLEARRNPPVWGPPPSIFPPPPSMKRGGMVHRTAMYRLHRGEQVLKKSLAQRYREEKHGGKMDAGCR